MLARTVHVYLGLYTLLHNLFMAFRRVIAA